MKPRNLPTSFPSTSPEPDAVESWYRLSSTTWTLLFFGLSLGLHHQGFASPMIYDSHGWINGKSAVYASHNLREIFSIVPMRPLFTASLYGNYLLTGLDPLWFRVTNALILAATAAVLVRLLVLLVTVQREQSRLQPANAPFVKLTALFLGLVFVVHPLQTFVVLYIWQREAILACLFYFACMAVYVAGRSGRLKPGASYVLTGILFFAGLCSKENVVSLPVVLLLAELTVFRQGFRGLLKRSLTIAAVTLPPLLAYLLLTHYLHGAETVHQPGVLVRLYDYYAGSGLTPLDVALTQCRVVVSYLIMILAPILHPMQLVAPQVISTSIWNPTATLPALLAVLGVAGIGIALVRRSPLSSFGILFLFISLAPESLLIPQYLYFGYRAILPMGGVLLLVGMVVLGLARELNERLSGRIFKPVLAGGLLIPLVLLASMTLSQAKRWNPVEFWQGAYAHAPAFSAHVERTPYQVIVTNLGAVLIDAREYTEAIGILKKAVMLDPDAPVAKLNLGLALLKSGESKEAVEILRQVTQTYPEMPVALTLLGQALIEEGNKDEGMDKLRQAVKLNPADESARLKLTAALIEADRVSEAVVNLQRALQDNPTSTAARLQMGFAMKKTGNFPESIRQFREVLAMDPTSAAAYQGLILAERGLSEFRMTLEALRKNVAAHPDSSDAHYRLGNALMKSGNHAEAVNSFRSCLELKPDFAEASANMGAALLSVGRIPEAIENLRNALTVLTTNAELHNALGVALLRRGNTPEAVEQFRQALAIDPEHVGARQNLEGIVGRNTEAH